MNALEVRAEKERTPTKCGFGYTNLAGSSCQQVANLVENVRNHKAEDEIGYGRSVHLL